MISESLQKTRSGSLLFFALADNSADFFRDAYLNIVGKRLVMNRYGTLVGHKLLEEQSLRISVRDMLEFGIMEEDAIQRGLIVLSPVCATKS
jgi:hypothetical protein